MIQIMLVRRVINERQKVEKGNGREALKVENMGEGGE